MNVKVLAVIAIIITILGISVSYASLTRLVEITSVGSVRSATWDIHVENLSDATINGDVVINSEPKLVNTDLSTGLSGLDVKFNANTGSVTYTFDLVNNGDLNAIIDEIILPVPVCTAGTEHATESVNDETNVCNAITYQLSYVGSSDPVVTGYILNAKSSVRLQLTLSYSDRRLPINEVDISGLNYEITYRLHDA